MSNWFSLLVLWYWYSTTSHRFFIFNTFRMETVRFVCSQITSRYSTDVNRFVSLTILFVESRFEASQHSIENFAWLNTLQGTSRRTVCHRDWVRLQFATFDSLLSLRVLDIMVLLEMFELDTIAELASSNLKFKLY